jgi:hypothetical protein
MPFAVDYPALPSGSPRHLSAQFITECATALRFVMFGTRGKPLEANELAAKATRFVINGRPMRIWWDIEHDVCDLDGKCVLGVCEHDPDEPDAVMISVSGPRLASRPATLRSTAVHELAHAIFDMPVALGSRARKIIRTVVEERRPAKGRKIDWPEWRVGVFMGAFIVPLDRLANAVARQAGAMDMPFRWRSGPNGLPLPSIAGDRDADMIDCLVESLADSFGVSPAFMAVRLKKGGFVAPHLVTFEGRA